MAKYKIRFQTVEGGPLPVHVHPQVVKGRFYTHFNGPNFVPAKRGEGSIKGATLLRSGRVQLSQGWWDSYYALLRGAPLPETAAVEPGRVVPGSWEALINHYKAHSTKWLTAGPTTQSNYRPYHDSIIRAMGRLQVAKTLDAIEPHIHAKQFGVAGKVEAAPMAAKDLRTVFNMLCEHARTKLKWIAVNPVRDIEKPKSANKDGLHTWTESEVAFWRRAFPDYASDARAILEIDLAFGARASDLLQLGFKNITGDEISFQPKKTKQSTGRWVHLEASENVRDGEHLMAVLAARNPDQRYFFQQPPKGFNQYSAGSPGVTSLPLPRSYTWLTKEWGKWRAQVAALPGAPDGIAQCTPHGLRKCFATRMADAGASLTDIADALGDTEESARIYVKARNSRKGAKRAQRQAAAEAA